MGVFLQLVLPQHFPREVAGATDCADVISFTSVYLHMVFIFSSHPFRELLSTVLTLKYHVLLFSMHYTCVSAQGSTTAKAASTLTTLKGLLSSVNCHVVAKTTTVGKLGRTKLASKSFVIRLVTSFVGIQTGAAGIALSTLVTIVLPLLTMYCPFVVVKALFFLRVVRTLFTLEEDGPLHMFLLHMCFQAVPSPVEETTHSADELRLAPMFAIHVTDRFSEE